MVIAICAVDWPLRPTPTKSSTPESADQGRQAAAEFRQVVVEVQRVRSGERLLGIAVAWTVAEAGSVPKHVADQDGAMRRTKDPDEALLAFCRRTYEAGASLGRWDRARLERTEPSPMTAAT